MSDRPAEDRFPHDEGFASSAGALTSANADDVRAAVERVYEVFAKAKLSKPLVACPHCFTENDVRYLEKTPLRKFNNGDCSTIAHKTVSTLGTEKDLRYFLPRLLEHAAEGGDFVLLAGFLEKLVKAAKAWNPHEIAAAYAALKRISANAPEFSDFHDDDVKLYILELGDMASPQADSK
ncbi:MAG TPA: hypothetical protein VFL13_04960 [Candidatus Baltobacteraceae bacterium]|nr:hypothetical protein [Candidatus Baltobacteraceae bacterium]